jgi:hypothetical protein
LQPLSIQTLLASLLSKVGLSHGCGPMTTTVLVAVVLVTGLVTLV